METLGPIFQARSRPPGTAALSPPTHAAAGVFYREVRQCTPQRNFRVCAPIANRLCALDCHSTPILLLPRPEVEPAALCFGLPLASDSPHTAPTHTSAHYLNSMYPQISMPASSSPWTAPCGPPASGQAVDAASYLALALTPPRAATAFCMR
jgi:hypothetical protein